MECIHYIIYPKVRYDDSDQIHPGLNAHRTPHPSCFRPSSNANPFESPPLSPPPILHRRIVRRVRQGLSMRSIIQNHLHPILILIVIRIEPPHPHPPILVPIDTGFVRGNNAIQRRRLPIHAGVKALWPFARDPQGQLGRFQTGDRSEPVCGCGVGADGISLHVEVVERGG